jgi:hypothetical protein
VNEQLLLTRQVPCRKYRRAENAVAVQWLGVINGDVVFDVLKMFVVVATTTTIFLLTAFEISK